MHTYLTYVLLPSGWWPVRESQVDSANYPSHLEAKAASRDRARQLYTSHVTKTIILEFK